MTVGGKILITSKRSFAAGDSSDILPLRKPIRGCYCVYNYKKNKLKFKPTCTTDTDATFWPCNYCKSYFDIKFQNQLATINDDNDYRLPGTPTFSCDTFKKINKINYTPTSEFLGNVKRKTSKQSNYINKTNSLMSVMTGEQQTSRPKSSKKLSTADNYSLEPLESRQLGSEKNNAPEIQTIFTSTTSNKNSSSSLTENKLKKTISSSLEQNSRDQKQKLINKNLPRVVVLNNSRCSTCLIRDDGAKNLTTRRQVCGKCGGKRISLLSTDKSDSETDKETRELGEFRNMNYFETHGSSRTLLSNRSTAELLKQHQLNDRLFPEPVDKENLVVSVPLLSTDQFIKIIHYFPGDIVRQYCKNKVDTDTGEKKKKSIQRKCPLTGHPINLYKFNNIKKPESYFISNNDNINSLALNFQKKIT